MIFASSSIFFLPPFPFPRVRMGFNDLRGLTGDQGRCSRELLWFRAPFPGRPTASPPAGRGPTPLLLDGNMARTKQPSRHVFSSSSSSTAGESIDVASGPGVSFSQTTDTNWQHVSRFTDQTSSRYLETHLNSLSGVSIEEKKRTNETCSCHQILTRTVVCVWIRCNTLAAKPSPGVSCTCGPI